ncbi:uncharacterized protein LOC124953391 [Vespa velutina]|uniref:uncharacterized protein LOC124953391 n=1 Tax=Vespa velutina TaxID=202808 RepID=UPI001FB223B0|nr:uncharacterized protein LOC124953391 [Vespa velutina]
MDDLQKKIQMYLMKENQGNRELTFLTARTTIENTIKIDDLCKSISEIILSFDLVSEDIKLILNPKCVSAFKYLMLNTNFTVQKRLGEDMAHGHLVDMCPTLSPYLFIQILWKLEYEDILVESILHLPLDLCIEIIEITRRSIEELEFDRAINIIFQLIINVYKKFILIANNGSQSSNIIQNINIMTAYFQELLLLLNDERIIRMEKVSVLKKYKRYGLLLKRIIKIVKDCQENIGNNFKISEDIGNIYKITFGREPIVKCDDLVITQAITTIRQDLMSLLLKKIKEIDCNIYLGWAELDDTENPTITLQKAIGNECYYLVEFFKANKELAENEHLIECLLQLSSKPISEEINSVLTLEELRYGTVQGKKECVKELISRYKEWDETILNSMKEIWKKLLLDKYDCLNLLEYLTFVLNQADNEDYQQRVYIFVTEVLIHQNLQSIYSIIVEYITKHDGKNCLESLYTEEIFKDFIIRHTNMKSLKTLKIILMFLLKSPKKVLRIILRIAIGYPEYENVMISAQDMLLLSPIMNIREDSNETFLSSTLKTICLENVEWNVKKFKDLLFIMVDNKILTIEGIINNILLCYLKENVRILRNTHCILNCSTKMLNDVCDQWQCQDIIDGSIIKINARNLLVPLAQMMSSTRRRTDVSYYLINDVIKEINSMIYHVLLYHTNDFDLSIKRAIIEDLEYILEPIEKVYFILLWPPLRNDFYLSDNICDYERRCFFILNMIKDDPTISNELRTFFSNFSLLHEDFLRHIILRSTSFEYSILAKKYIEENLFLYSNRSKTFNNITPYNNFLRLTMEACCLSLEYPSLLPKHSFTFILNNCIKLLQNCLIDEEYYDNSITEFYQHIIENMRSLVETIKLCCSPSYSSLFTNFFARINNTNSNINDEQNTSEIMKIQTKEFLDTIEGFTNQCVEFNESYDQVSSQNRSSTKMSKYRLIHLFISACIKVPASKAYECIEIMNDFLAST